MSVKPIEAVEKADSILEDWDDVCKELDIPHFLIYGTCLGFYRDGGYITIDTDLDVRVICDKKKWRSLVKELGKRGIAQSGKPQGWEFYRDGILLCIERSEKVGTIVHDDGREYEVMPLYHSFDTVTYKGRKYNVPHPVEKYLEGRYGEDWRTPVLKWNKHKDAKGA